MRLLVTVLVLGTGCSSILGLEPPVQKRGDSGVDDARLDDGAAEEDAPELCTSFSSFVNTCNVDFTDVIDLSAGNLITFNTDTKVVSGFGSVTVEALDVTGPAGPITFIVVESGSIAFLGNLRMVGSRAGGILSNSTLSIDGTLDVGNGGAAARVACGSTAGQSLAQGGAGGGGGGFWGAGGGGGDGDNGASNGGTGGPAQSRPASPLGGCAGSAGGAGTSLGGAGGLGGGGILLIARTSITIDGTIDANGQGGRGGSVDSSGGGGGGAGGMVVFEAPIVTIAGVVAANGGGGGEGAGANAGQNGANGGNSSQRALGGSGGASAGTDGALGGAGTTLDGNPVTGVDGGGGGGGGGGVGFVVVKGPAPVILSGGVVSPTVTVVP